MKFALTVIAVAIAVFGVGAPAQAASRHSATAAPTITLDPNDTGLDLAPSAADWSVRTGVTVQVGSCDAGPYCVEFSKDQCASGEAGGCAWGGAAGVCNASVSQTVYDFDYWLTVYIISHEVGHCVQRFAGYGMFHLSDPSAVMYSTCARQTMRENETKLTADDRRMSVELWNGTWTG